MILSAHASPQRSAATAGEIVTVDGKVVGRHDGYEAFTVGQRKGLGVAMGRPYFVVRIDPESRQVVIGPKGVARPRRVGGQRRELAGRPRPSAPRSRRADSLQRAAKSSGTRVGYRGDGPVSCPL